VTTTETIRSYRFVQGILRSRRVFPDLERPEPTCGEGFEMSKVGQACASCRSPYRFYRFDRLAGHYICHCGNCLKTLVIEGVIQCQLEAVSSDVSEK
jgi:hypothetical protein